MGFSFIGIRTPVQGSLFRMVRSYHAFGTGHGPLFYLYEGVGPLTGLSFSTVAGSVSTEQVATRLGSSLRGPEPSAGEILRSRILIWLVTRTCMMSVALTTGVVGIGGRGEPYLLVGCGLALLLVELVMLWARWASLTVHVEDGTAASWIRVFGSPASLPEGAAHAVRVTRVGTALAVDTIGVLSFGGLRRAVGRLGSQKVVVVGDAAERLEVEGGELSAQPYR